MARENEEITCEFLTEVTPSVVSELNGLMHQLTTDPDEVTVGRLREILDAGTRILVAREAGRLVGTASVVVMKQMRRYKGWLEDIVVDEAYRGRGIAQRLMELGIECAREEGCGNINMTSKPGRESAWKLYESLGFRQRETNVFRLEL